MSAHDHGERIHRSVPHGDSRPRSCFRASHPGLFLVADGRHQRGMDVAQSALLHPGHLHHCGHPDAHHRHPEHLYLRRAHGRAISRKHRDCLAGPPQATACAAGAKGAMTDHVGTAALGCRGDGRRLPNLPLRVEASAQKTPIGAASGKGATSQVAERLPFGAGSARARLRRLRKNTTFRDIGKGTTSVVPITLFPSPSRAGMSQRGNLLSRVFSQAVRSRLLFLLLLLLSVQVAWSSALGPSKPNSPQSAAPSFNSTRAMQYVREVVAFGPRPIGSANHKKVENYIHSLLKGDLVEDDAFTATTPEGKFPVRNIIAKFPGTRDGIIVIAGHYDTNYPLRKTGYVGANDGGSSTALLLELANQLRGRKRDGYSVWLLWTDGEEAVKDWTATDSLYGTRHLAEKWQNDGTLKKINSSA